MQSESQFKLGKTSLANLRQVHPTLVRVVSAAIEITTQDFTVFEGARSKAQAAANLAKGVSKTTHSLHVLQPDGFAHAVDLVPWHNDGPRWEWPLIYPIAEAMIQAAKQLDVDLESLRWGGVWDKRLAGLAHLSVDGLKAEVAAYCIRHNGPDFLDGPHFELRI